MNCQVPDRSLLQDRYNHAPVMPELLSHSDALVGSCIQFQEARAIAYADDGYIKGRFSVALHVLAELKRVLKEDAGLELNLQDIHPPQGHHSSDLCGLAPSGTVASTCAAARGRYG